MLEVRQTESFSGLLEDVRNVLLAHDPDVTRVRPRVMHELGLPSESATELIYKVVLSLNLSLFPPVTHVELVHTEGCNLACTYCFEKNMLGHRRMPIDVARLAVDLIFDYSGDRSSIAITHFGGEPTMNFRAIQFATEYAEKKSAAAGKLVDFDMTSNGILLDEDMVGYFADHNIRVLLSIDGCESTHDKFRVDKRGRGTFKRVLKGLEILKKRQPWIGTKMTIMPENAGTLYEDVLGLYSLGVNHFIIGHATGVEWPENAVTTFEYQLSQLYQWYKANPLDDLRIDDFEKETEEAFFGCQAGRNSIAVSVSGEISPCSKIMGFNSKNLVGKLGDVWHGLTHLRNREEFVSTARVKAACEEQGIARDFEGGCFAANYGESGDLFQPSLQEHRFSLLRRSACGGCSGCSH
jgi:uncharacterized protein